MASTFFALLTVAANIVVVSVVTIVIAARTSPRVAGWWRETRRTLAPSALSIAWLAAFVSTAGSLFYSESAHFRPCVLCWYQRIGMYPLVVILGIAALRRDHTVARYVLPVVAGGGLISAYHYQLQRFPEQASFSCAVDVPCTLTWVWEFHYISIPFMALSGFALIATCLLIAGRSAGLEP